MTSRITSTIITCIFAFITCVPAAAAAENPLRVADGDVVTRGDFIRAAVKVLDVSAGDNVVLPYIRVPRALRMYIEAAHEKDALEVFGNDLLLAQGITRGDALFVIMKLGDYRSIQQATFNDVRSGSDIEEAVALAMENNWMSPLRNNIFGARRMLLGKDANLLLRKVRGDNVSVTTDTDEIVQPLPKVRFNIKNRPRASTPLPKTQILEAIWEIINNEFLYDDRIDPDDVAFSAAEAIVKALDDPYTTFMRPAVSEDFQNQIKGEISGIGAQVEHKDGFLTIVAPITGSPAEAAGLRAGDRIIEVDGIDLIPLGFLEAVNHVRGERGSTAKLKISRNGTHLFIDVIRDVISVPEIIISWNDDIAVVKLVQFGRVTQEDLRDEMTKIAKKSPRGIVLDLRNNPGGLLEAADTVMSNFLPKGTPFAQIRSKLVTRTERTSKEPVVDASTPVIVLINGGSASASEIVAGAMQDTDRALIVGERSFGKGTVQQVLQFNDQSAFKMTVAEWLTPNGRKINEEGVHPDVEVVEGDRDEQLSRALDLLR